MPTEVIESIFYRKPHCVGDECHVMKPSDMTGRSLPLVSHLPLFIAFSLRLTLSMSGRTSGCSSQHSVIRPKMFSFVSPLLFGSLGRCGGSDLAFTRSTISDGNVRNIGTV